jgi:N-acetyl-gamma-glutamylphosphate reductase
MSSDSRLYELVLLGATGYTGNLTAEYIQEHVAIDLRWAIAGRNEKKLKEIAEELKALNPDRVQPGMQNNLGRANSLLTLPKSSKFASLKQLNYMH